MKTLCITLLLCLATLSTTAQSRRELLQQIAELSAKVESLGNKVAELERSKAPLTTEHNDEWEAWRDLRYNYGFNTAKTPVFNTFDCIVESNYMMSVRGGRGRWNSTVGEPFSKFVDGGHLFEGWNASETCRLTMLIGKQAPDIACIQVYSPKGLYKSKRHFGWVKLGSDDACEGVDFGRRWAVSFVPFTLGAFDKAPENTYNHNLQLESTAVPVGTLYYDKRVGKIGCMTAEGWRYLKFE